MALITQSEYGKVTVNNKIIVSMIVDEMMSMGESVIPCSKKGKIINQRFFSNSSTLNQSVEFKEIEANKENRFVIELYFITRFGDDVEKTTDTLFDKVEKVFDLFCLDPPIKLVAHIKGKLTGVGIPSSKTGKSGKQNQIISEDSEIIRYNG